MKLLIILLCMFQFSNIQAQVKQELRGVKLTNVDSDLFFTDNNIAKGMDYLASIGINTVFVCVWNRGYTLYPSKIMNDRFSKPIIPEFNGRDPLKRVIIEAHRNGIEVIPWFEYGFAATYGQNGGHLLAKYPSWGLKSKDGKLTVKNGFDWLNPINPEVQDFILSLGMEIIDNYEIDGFVYSDRIPAMPVEGGYDSVTVSIYKSEHSGVNPPDDFKNQEWMKWRAGKLSTYFKKFKDSVKTRDKNLVIIASPSVYPWGYDEYLQDSKTWLDMDIMEALVPQIYRYNIEEYNFELKKSLSFIPESKKNIFYSGMLIKLGSYVIPPDFLFSSMNSNRSNNINGEVMFFYEGLRANKNLLGDTLKSTYYKEPALLPYRNGKNRRPPAIILNEDEPGTTTTGIWQKFQIAGYKPNILWSNDSGYASITYSLNVPADAWYSIFTYIVPNFLNTPSAPYTIFSQTDSSIVIADQSDVKNTGWYKLKDVYLTKGYKRIIKLDNRNIASGKYILADAVMLMVNRYLSPDVQLTSINEMEDKTHSIPEYFELMQNYPNPFNPSTVISFEINAPNYAPVQLKIYDILGREVKSLINEYKAPGIHSIVFDAKGLAGGTYFYKLSANGRTEVRKMVLVK